MRAALSFAGATVLGGRGARTRAGAAPLGLLPPFLPSFELRRSVHPASKLDHLRHYRFHSQISRLSLSHGSSGLKSEDGRLTAHDLGSVGEVEVEVKLIVDLFT